MSADHDLVTTSFEAATAYGDPVLTYLDVEGLPASVRVALDRDARTLHATLPAGAPRPAAGPANLLAHHHDEQLWDLRQTMVRGEVRGADDGRVTFLPSKVVAGARPGTRAAIELVRVCRRSAARELDRRGLPRPRVDWASIGRVAKRASSG